MAEALGVAAAILQIAGMGAKMSLTLHKIGVEAATAGAQLNSMSKGISLFSQMLKQVGQTLRQEDSVHSPGAVETTQEIVEQCRGIYDQIQKMIDRAQSRDSNGVLRPISLAERVRFCFQKTKIECLLGELDSLKMTLSTMIQVLYTGRLMAMFQQLQDLGNAQKAEKDEKKEEIQLERDEVQSLVISRHWALVRLSQLQSQVAQEEEVSPRAIEPGDVPSVTSRDAKASTPAKKDDKRLVVFTEKSLAVLDASLSAARDRPGELMLRSHNFVDYLLDRWTIIREITACNSSWVQSEKGNPSHLDSREARQSRRSSAPGPKRSKYRPAEYTSDESDDDSAYDGRHKSTSKQKPHQKAASPVPQDIVRRSGNEPDIRWWRGSRKDSRRTFIGNELASFKVMGSGWDRVTAASFPEDEWTDVPDSWVSRDALTAWDYKFKSYQKKTGEKVRDRDLFGESQGRDGEDITEEVHRVQKPLTWAEVEDLCALTAAIRKATRTGNHRIANNSTLVPRRRNTVDDMPYPDAPFGKLGHIAENFLKEGKQVSPDKLNVLGSLIESKLSKKISPEVVKTLKPMIFDSKTKQKSWSSDED